MKNRGIIVISSLVVIGGGIAYLLWKRKKNKEEQKIKDDEAAAAAAAANANTNTTPKVDTTHSEICFLLFVFRLNSSIFFRRFRYSVLSIVYASFRNLISMILVHLSALSMIKSICEFSFLQHEFSE